MHLFQPSFFLFLFVVLYSCQSPETPAQEGAVSGAPEIRTGSLEVNGVSKPTLVIDSLVWLAENLNLETSDSWCYGEEEQRGVTHGRLYRWKAAGEACAALGDGWRLPTDAEWQQLARAFGGFYDWIGDRSAGDPVAANTGLVTGGGFKATLGGWRGSAGGFDGLDQAGFYWTATAPDEVSAWYFQLAAPGGRVVRRQAGQDMGMSCRCVRSK
jgi:uncharacterized protein (TIGR02145 family)